jgi:D-alanine-D-alanine ligase-like ATP-grasp enzyme
MQNKCEYCGNNPVPHFLQWSSESMVIVMTPLNRWMARTGLVRVTAELLDSFFSFWWWLFERFGLARFHEDRKTWSIERAQVLWEEAEARGIKMKGAILFGRHVDYYCATLGNGTKMYFTGLPRPEESRNSEIEFWVDDKGVLKDKLTAAGVPVSPGGNYSDFDSLVKRFRELQKPVIIKPRLGSRGRHTTTHIYTEDELKHAFKVAKQLCHWVIMEEHLNGDVFRGTVIGGKLAGVLGGSPPRITGDGVHTIQELVKAKNAANADQRVKPIRILDSTEEFLARQNMTLNTVLPAGTTIDMTEKVGISYGGSSYEITEETHPEIKKALEEAAAVIGDPLLGFDFIIDDVRTSPQGKRWGIIECNGMPFINLHHHPLIGQPNNVARHVWDLHM